MADPKKVVGYWHNGHTGRKETRDALEAKGFRVVGQNFTYFNPDSVRPFDTVVAEVGVDVDVLKAAYGETPVLTAAEAAELELPSPEAAEKKQFDPDAPAKPKRAKKQG